MICSPFKYLKILFIAFQWSSQGFHINWLILFALNVVSGLVMITYYRAPTILLYSLAFRIDAPLSFERWRLLIIGVGRLLAWSIFVSWSILEIYFLTRIFLNLIFELQCQERNLDHPDLWLRIHYSIDWWAVWFLPGYYLSR